MLAEIRKWDANVSIEPLDALSDDFDAAYSHEGRPSIPPEMLLSALLLRPLFGIRSERQLMEQMNDNLLYRWFGACRLTIRSGWLRASARTANGWRAMTF